MNRVDSCLQRLYRAAAAQPAQELPTEAPFGFETRVLCSWRAGTPPEAGLLAIPVLQRGVIYACAVLVISAFFGLRSLSETPANPLVVVDSAIRLCWMQ